MNTLIGTVRLGHELMNSIRIRAVGLGESVIVVKACPLMTARGRKALCYAYGLLRFALVLIKDQCQGDVRCSETIRSMPTSTSR